MMRAEAVSNWIVAILLGMAFYFCGISFNDSTSIVLKSLGLIAVLVFIYRGVYFWKKPRTETSITTAVREDFIKGLARHLMWASIVIFVFEILHQIKDLIETRKLPALHFQYMTKQYISGWLILCAPYLFLQVICHLIYKRFYYLTFFVTYSWVPKGYKHEPKDGVFSGLCFLLVIIVVVTFPGLWRT